MEKLKPCPFCGSENLKFDKCVCKVTCLDCYAKSPNISKFKKEGVSDEEATILAWNTRKEKK